MYERRGGDVDPQKILLARRQFEKQLRKQRESDGQRDAGLNDWNEKGPQGIGGRSRCMVIDPNNSNHLFFGAVSGGIWETSDGGTNWSQADDFLGALTVMQIQYDPFNSNRLFASTGEGVFNGDALPGLGVFVSTDNGATWDPLPMPAGNDFFYVNDIVADPGNQDWIYAVTTVGTPGNPVPNNGTIYRSTDGGENWTLLLNTASGALDIKIDPFDSDNILVGCRSHLYLSTDAENGMPTFTEITGGTNQIPANAGRIEISYCPSNADRVYASVQDGNGNNGEIWRSEDGGSTWTQRNGMGFLATQGWYDNVVFVDPSNSARIIVGGIELWRSTDGGNTLTRITRWQDDINGNGNGNNNSIHADQHAIVPFNNYNGNTNNGVYIANDGGLYSTNNIWTVTQNSGWLSNVGDMAVTQFYGGSISEDGNVVIGGSQDNSFSFSTDGGNNWTQPVTGDGAYSAVNYENDSIIYSNINNNSIFKSTDKGTTWNRIARFTTAFNNGNCVPAACCTGNQYPAAGCVNNGVFYVEDFCGLISLFVMDPNDPDIILAGCQELWRNPNAGNANNWTSIKNAIGTSRISAIDVDFGNTQRIWVGYGNGTVERSTNTGSSWSGNISPATAFVTDICINPNNSNEVIVSFGGYNQTNLFYTNNGNATTPTWTNINLGIDLQINSVEWHPGNSNWIYVGTDFGVMASDDKGQNWNITPLYDAHDGPVNTEVSELFWQPNSTIICAATHGRGIWCSNEIRDKIYVDKNFTGTEDGSFSNPFNTFKEALNAAGNGSEIIFLSGGTYNEIPNAIIETRRIKVTLDPGAGSPVIIE